MKDEKIKITYEAHGETHTAELPPGTSLPRVVHAMMLLLIAGGYSRDNITNCLEILNRRFGSGAYDT